MPDYANQSIRKVEIATATVTTLAGNSKLPGAALDGKGTNALFNLPFGVTSDGTYLYVNDVGNNTIRKIE